MCYMYTVEYMELEEFHFLEGVMGELQEIGVKKLKICSTEYKETLERGFISHINIRLNLLLVFLRGNVRRLCDSFQYKTSRHFYV
jgi:hypothetical protein